ncbi:MAG: hypothetical protein JW976_03205 [Syntrophaceae bacterium]|nr:hypothetical protein [Syntrophaceae bacterium]
MQPSPARPPPPWAVMTETKNAAIVMMVPVLLIPLVSMTAMFVMSVQEVAEEVFVLPRPSPARLPRPWVVLPDKKVAAIAQGVYVILIKMTKNTIVLFVMPVTL